MTKPSGKATALQRALEQQKSTGKLRLDWRLFALVGGTVLLLSSAFFAWQSSLIRSEMSGVDQAAQVSAWEVSALSEVLDATQKKVQRALQADSVVQALASNGQEAHDKAAAALKLQLPELISVDFYDADIVEVMHNDLAKFGYAKAAMLMQARNQRQPAPIQSHIDSKAARYLLLAQPVFSGEKVVGYAMVQMPFAAVQQLFRQAKLSDARVDLRQGDGRGDLVIDSIGATSGVDSKTNLGLPIPGTEFRIATVQPELYIVTPHSLWISLPLCLLSLIAGVSLFWIRKVGPQQALATMRRESVITKEEPTLMQTLNQTLEAKPRAAKQEGAAKLTAAAKKAESRVNLDRSIFRAYDIRGVLGSTLDTGIARLIGHAIGSEAQERGLREIVVGRDGRLSGPDLSAALIEGLRAAGCDVIDVGAVPTPTLYFASYFLNTGSGVMVTGSHNPPDYNGFKIVLGNETLAEGAIQNLYARISENRLSAGNGNLQTLDVTRDYLDRITGDVQVEHKMKVVVDCGNGIAGAIAPAVLEGIGCEVFQLYCDVDGTFPNHHPDPSDTHNLQDLIMMVKQVGADIGVAFDGDGDRLGVVTKNGEIIYPDRLLMLFAMDVLSRNPGAAIIYDVKCTGHLQSLILKHGGSPLMWKTGHSLIKSKMREIDAELAGEMSGHFFFRERWYGFDDGIYSAARLMEILASDAAGRDPQQIFDSLPKGVSTPELKIPMPEGEHYRFIEKFKEKSSFEGARVTTIDGVRADYPDGWGLVRCSNTTPCLVLRFDADNGAALERIQDTFRSQLRALEPSLSMPF